MHAILQAAQQQRATDILTIDNRIWFRVLGKLQPHHTAQLCLKIYPLGSSESRQHTFDVCKPISPLSVSNIQVKSQRLWILRRDW